jgi:transposase
LPLTAELRAAVTSSGQTRPQLWHTPILAPPQQNAVLRCLIEQVAIPRRARDLAQTRLLLTRRRQLVQRLTAARRRLQSAPQRRRADIQAHIAWLECRLARTAADLAAAIRSSPRWHAKDDMLQSPPGVGPLLSHTLVAEVPEWGAWKRQTRAALSGVAPCNCESGTWRGKRAVWGGRAHGRAVLYMSPLAAVRHTPVLKAFFARRRAVGQAPQVALTACRRKRLTLRNAMLQHQTPWHENSAQHS